MLPSLFVEAAFGVSPMVTPTGAQWVDISAYMREVHSQRGRRREIDRFGAGSLLLRLKNIDRRFDPTNTASPYYPNVIPGVRVRVRAVWQATSYTLWTGFVEAWPPSWPGNYDGVVDVRATDHLGFNLSTKKLNSNRYGVAINAQNPTAFWRLSDPIGSGVASDSGPNGYTAFVNQQVAFGQLGPLLQVADLAADFGQTGINASNAAGFIQVPAAAAVNGTGDFTIALWCQVPSGRWASYSASLWSQLGSGFGNNLSITLDTNGRVVASQAGLSDLLSGVAVNDGNWHMVVLTRSGTLERLYVDGALKATGTIGAAVGFSPYLALIGGGTVLSGSTFVGSPMFPGLIAEVSLGSLAWNNATIAQLYGYGPNLWSGQLSGTRFGTVLDVVGVSTSDRAVDPGVSTLGPEKQNIAQTDVLTYLQRLQETENAQVFCDASGRLSFFDRTHNLKAPFNASQATFADVNPATGTMDSGTLPYVPDGVKFNYDVVEVNSEVSVQRYGGVAQFAQDLRGGGNGPPYGPRTLQRTAQLYASDGQALDAANWLLAARQDPQLRCDELVIDPRSNDLLWPQVLGREIGDLVTVVRRPPGGGAQISLKLRIEGVSQAIVGRDRKWVTVFNLSPASTDQYLILDDSALGYLETNPSGLKIRLGY